VRLFAIPVWFVRWLFFWQLSFSRVLTTAEREQ